MTFKFSTALLMLYESARRGCDFRFPAPVAIPDRCKTDFLLRKSSTELFHRTLLPLRRKAGSCQRLATESWPNDHPAVGMGRI
ncbi:hypothetical protein Mapa_005605 [Marchantia paleacea]|nr:hypothetical protein Mapa_005605 [Marchantia paleacea]